MLAERAKRTAQIKIEVEPRLHRRVKVRAAECGKTITRYVTEALEQRLSAERAEPKEGGTLAR